MVRPYDYEYLQQAYVDLIHLAEAEAKRHDEEQRSPGQFDAGATAASVRSTRTGGWGCIVGAGGCRSSVRVRRERRSGEFTAPCFVFDVLDNLLV